MERKSPSIRVRTAQPPPFWNRRVLFFSNLHSIFYGNVEATRQLMDEITGAHTYGGRVIAILDLLFRLRPNLMLLEVPPHPSLIHHLAHSLGISIPKHEILDARGYAAIASAKSSSGLTHENPLLKTLREHPAEWVDGFVTDTALVTIAELLGKQTISTLKGSKNGNNKYLLYQHLRSEGLPVFDTFEATDLAGLEVGLKRLSQMGYRNAVVKAQIGASGYGMLLLPADASEAGKVPGHVLFEGPCMVQGWMENGVLGMRRIASPSAQLFLDDDTAFLYDMTEQILSENSVHQGNISPPPVVQQFPEVERELLRQAAIAAQWLHEQGYRGTASVDFLVVERDKRLETIICEINARVTGATYPAFLARHFKPRGAWLMRNIGFRRALDGDDLFRLMEHAGVLYRPGKASGIIPFNFNTDADGKVIKGQFVCLGDEADDCSRRLMQAWSHLPVEWGYDRD